MENLSAIERETYDLIKDSGEIQTRNLPDKRMIGAVASLNDKELVEIHRKYTSIYRRRKKKFVRVKSCQNTAPSNSFG